MVLLTLLEIMKRSRNVVCYHFWINFVGTLAYLEAYAQVEILKDGLFLVQLTDIHFVEVIVVGLPVLLSGRFLINNALSGKRSFRWLGLNWVFDSAAQYAMYGTLVALVLSWYIVSVRLKQNGLLYVHDNDFLMMK